MTSIKQIIWVLVGSAVLIAALTYITTRQSSEPQLLLEDDGSTVVSQPPLTVEALEENEKLAITNTMNPVAVFTTSQGVFELELFALY
jgi:hypothetical protein